MLGIQEHAMTPTSDIRRRPDGSIDIDFYRQAAAHERQQMVRRAFARCKGAINRFFAIVGARPAVARPLAR
jgi:hypothetical protein